MRRAVRQTMLVGMTAVAAAPAGCEPYRIEYHRRPDYYQRMSDSPLPDRVQLDDGTIIVYNAKEGSKPALDPVTGEEPEQFKVREEMEDGTIILRAVMPEHVLANTLTCLKREEYELLWDQMVSERTKLTYAARGLGKENFVEFCGKHRLELAKTLNRMRLGLATHEVVVEGVGDGVIELRFWPQVAELFKFKKVAMVREGLGLKLLLIY